MIKTSELIKAYLKTEQNRYRILDSKENDHVPRGSLNVYRGKAFVATLIFNDSEAYITCKMMEGRRKVDLHHPKSLELLMETLECFEFIMSRVLSGEIDTLDVINICKDDEAWPRADEIEDVTADH